jgi:hypothetical protein
VRVEKKKEKYSERKKKKESLSTRVKKGREGDAADSSVDTHARSAEFRTAWFVEK